MGSDAKPAPQPSFRSVLAARLAVICGACGACLAAFESSDWQAMCHGQAVCVERASLFASALISAWCGLAALGWATLRPPHVRSRRCPERWFLLRALLSGGAVALLGWSALLGKPHLAVIGAMQANATFGAWLACEVQRGALRARAPSPTPEAQETCTPTRRGSMTLPRGWRYHRSTGLFEHKRTGRMQYDPPGTGETGSPLCNLPPCDEERALLDASCSDGFGSDSARDSGCDDNVRYGRSRTWHDGTRKERSRGAAPMNVWELRAAMERRSGSKGSLSEGHDAV